MTNFKHPCFVRVEDAENRKEIIEWLEMMGYQNGIPYTWDYKDEDTIIIATENWINNSSFCWYLNEPMNEQSLISDLNAIDCGFSIDLFKAIAAINDQNDYMQWFTYGETPEYYDWWMCKETKAEKNDSMLKKATTSELIEYFKNK